MRADRIGHAPGLQTNQPRAGHILVGDHDVIRRLHDLPRKKDRHRAYRRVAEVLQAAFGKRPLFRVVELLLVASADFGHEIQARLRVWHPAVRGVDDQRGAVLALHHRELPDVVDEDVGIDEPGHLAANGRDELLGLLRRGHQAVDTRQPLEHREKCCRPDSLKIRVAVLGSRNFVRPARLRDGSGGSNDGRQKGHQGQTQIHARPPGECYIIAPTTDGRKTNDAQIPRVLDRSGVQLSGVAYQCCVTSRPPTTDYRLPTTDY